MKQYFKQQLTVFCAVICEQNRKKWNVGTINYVNVIVSFKGCSYQINQISPLLCLL